MADCFEDLFNASEILKIESEDGRFARGAHIPNAITVFHDNGTECASYRDTGVFVLFKGNDVFRNIENTEYPKFKKCNDYIDSKGKTKKEIVFQSKTAAAEFVLGSSGHTNRWKPMNE